MKEQQEQRRAEAEEEVRKYEEAVRKTKPDLSGRLILPKFEPKAMNYMAPQPLKGKFKEPVYHFDEAPVDTFDEDLVISPEKAMAAVQHMQEKMRK